MATACMCKKCEIVTKHRPVVGQPNQFYCEVCGVERWYAKVYLAGDFPELTFDENEVIHEARAHGFGSSFPAFPTAKDQALATLEAAQKFLAQRPARYAE